MKTGYMQLIKFQSLALLAFLMIPLQFAHGAEFALMNRVISYDVNSGDAFWVVSTNSNMPANWRYPDDYYYGEIYTRYEVISVATNEPFGMQFGIFQYHPDVSHRDSVGELCELVRPLHGAGFVAINHSSPSTWWKDKGGVDFSRIQDLQSMSAIIYASNPNWPVSPPANGGDPAGLAWAQRFSWFPVTIRVTVVAVSSGSTFSGWDNYIPNPALQKATPTYGIDYIHETTDKGIPSTDEYSYYPTMHGAVSGNGTKISVPPGRELYFRTKAADGLKASEIQVLRVPVRPATPTFTLDQVNHRTSTAVSSDYEYCNFADMADAVTGNGTNVSIPAGTTKYFCTKATASSFKSKPLALNESTKSALPHEFVIFNDYADFPNNTDTNGFYYFYYNADMPVNWLTPENYYGGMIYIRYQLLNQVTSTPMGLQFGIWQMTPPETGELHETMSNIMPMNGPGTIAYSSGSLSVANDYWRLDNSLDFTRMNLTWHFGILPWKINPSDVQIRQENPSVWDERNTYFFPAKAYVTVVAVASGYNFSGFSNYLGVKPPLPVYTVNFATSKTNEIVPVTDEYSYNPDMSSPHSGTGAAIDLQPGQTVYFRTKAQDINPASDIGRIFVPAIPAAPTFTIDFTLAKTVQNIPSSIEYDMTGTFNSPAVGNGSQLTLTPGQNLYFRQKSSDSTFAGQVFLLTVPNQIMLGYTGADTITDNKFTIYALLNGVVPAITVQNIHVINGAVQNLQNGNVFDVYPGTKGPVSVYIPVNAIAGNSFASNTVNVYYDQLPTGIADLNGDVFRIYPNPSQDRKITVQTKLNVPYRLNIYSVEGTFVKSVEMNGSEYQQIDLGDLQKGMYFLKINSGRGVSMQKLVLQ
jgi:hypothetical protein